mmetsp:Transcript_42437/g.100908  ORF Transcript_42437/g.100908 Transcript_42437/m.100908 type:complete len:284 (-) Transcript_42437:2782-3633(-)
MPPTASHAARRNPPTSPSSAGNPMCNGSLDRAQNTGASTGTTVQTMMAFARTVRWSWPSTQKPRQPTPTGSTSSSRAPGSRVWASTAWRTRPRPGPARGALRSRPTLASSTPRPSSLAPAATSSARRRRATTWGATLPPSPRCATAARSSSPTSPPSCLPTTPSGGTKVGSRATETPSRAMPATPPALWLAFAALPPFQTRWRMRRTCRAGDVATGAGTGTTRRPRVMCATRPPRRPAASPGAPTAISRARIQPRRSASSAVLLTGTASRAPTTTFATAFQSP